jgi:hypothetical protein
MALQVLCGNQPGHNGPFFDIEFMHGHGQFSDKLYNQIYDVCGEAQLKAKARGRDTPQLQQPSPPEPLQTDSN